MLDPVINKHHDKIEEIQADLQIDIDSIIKSIDIDALIDDPQEVMEAVSLIISDKVTTDYLEPAVMAGIEFAKDIQKAKSIKVDDSKDPQKNEALDDKN
jgi:hypothetical protein